MRNRDNVLIAVCVVALLGSGSAVADLRRDGEVHEHVDTHFGHNQSYVDRGVVVNGIPHEAVAIRAGANRFYFNGGVWYRPQGRRFVVVSPLRGLRVPVLPALYTTLLIGGLTYYYANDTYYVWRDNVHQYEVVDAPAAAESAAVVTSTAAYAPNLFIYPKNGQTADQQDRDRYDCYRWGSEQTGFDPVVGGADQPAAKRDDYQRAMTACLEGRGYTVK